MGTLDGILLKKLLRATPSFADNHRSLGQSLGLSYYPEASGKLRQAFEIVSCPKFVSLRSAGFLEDRQRSPFNHEQSSVEVRLLLQNAHRPHMLQSSGWEKRRRTPT